MLVPSIFGEDLFDTFFDDFKRPARSNTNINVMRTDIKETDAGFELDIDLPGYKKEDVQAELKDGYLTISAKTNTTREEKDENGKYIRKERYSGSCSRSFYVGDYLTQEDVKARYENGVLTIAIPKKDAKKIEEKKVIAIEG